MQMSLGDPDESFDDTDLLFSLKVYKRDKHADKLAVALDGSGVKEDQVLMLEILQTVHNVMHEAKEAQALNVLNTVLENNKKARQHMNKAANLIEMPVAEVVN